MTQIEFDPLMNAFIIDLNMENLQGESNIDWLCVRVTNDKSVNNKFRLSLPFSVFSQHFSKFITSFAPFQCFNWPRVIAIHSSIQQFSPNQQQFKTKTYLMFVKDGFELPALVD